MQRLVVFDEPLHYFGVISAKVGWFYSTSAIIIKNKKKTLAKAGICFKELHVLFLDALISDFNCIFTGKAKSLLFFNNFPSKSTLNSNMTMNEAKAIPLKIINFNICKSSFLLKLLTVLEMPLQYR